MTLDCVLLKDSNRVFLAGLGPEISEYYKDHATLPNAVIHPAFNLIIDIPPRDPKGQHRSNKLSGATPCELDSYSISTYPGTSRDPVQPHSAPVRDVSFNAFWHSCSNRDVVGSLKCFQSRLAIRANTNIFFWSTLSFNFINTS